MYAHQSWFSTQVEDSIISQRQNPQGSSPDARGSNIHRGCVLRSFNNFLTSMHDRLCTLAGSQVSNSTEDPIYVLSQG